MLYLLSHSPEKFQDTEVCSLLGVSQEQSQDVDSLGSYLEASRNHSCKAMQMVGRI